MAAATKADRAKQKAEQDAILARVSVALARSQRLIDSWLPTASNSTEDINGHDESAQESTSNAGWGGLPDRVGLGGKVENTNGTNTHGSPGGSELDKLRKQLLGKKAGKGVAGMAAPKSGFTASKPMNGAASNGAGPSKGAAKAKAESDSEDEGGRSAAFKSKKQTANGAHPRAHPAAAAMGASVARETSEDSEDSQQKNISSKRKMSYLDELLAERSQKKKKKKKRKAVVVEEGQ